MLGSPVVLVIDTGGITRGIAHVDSRLPGLRPGGQYLRRHPEQGGEANATSRSCVRPWSAIPTRMSWARSGATARWRYPNVTWAWCPQTRPGDHGAADTMISRLGDAVSKRGRPGPHRGTIATTCRFASGHRTRHSQPRWPLQKAPRPKSGSPSPGTPPSVSTTRTTWKPSSARAPLSCEFDALNDPHLPEADGLFIGGGFPETHLQALSANESLREDIRTRPWRQACPPTPSAVA